MNLSYLKYLPYLLLTFVVHGCLVGCGEANKARDTMAFLERGRARGHLNVHTDARLSARADTDWSVGAKDTSVAFDGDVNFQHEGDETELSPPEPAKP